uniref:DNA replication complex GINS protein PSF3 n=1 Tax=Acrobeloides nanus TaxID=290746 RepID=A0A914C6L5_9BILA
MDLLKNTIDVDEDYYDVNSILAINSNVAVVFRKDTPKELFSLIGQKAPDSIPEKGFKTEVPAWFLPGLGLNVSVPRIFNPSNRDALRADAKTFNFTAIENGRHFYKLGMHLSRQVGGNQGKEIAGALLDSFNQRCEKIVRESVDPSRKPEKFDEAEKKIFETGQKIEQEMTYWMRNVDKYSLKRKRTEISVFQNRWSSNT